MKKHNTTKVHGSRFTVLGSRLNAVRSPRSALYALRSSLFPHPSSLIPQPSGNHGIALVLTLGILALVTLLLIAFVTSMRVENMASKNFNDLIKARQLAQGAVDQAVATIRNATANATYLTEPGAIFVFSGGSWTRTPLFTTVSTTATGSNDMNYAGSITGTNAVYGSSTNIWVGWSNITFNAELIGRYAYWVDDESGKVDINVAGTRGNDLEGRTPAAIDLQALFIPNDRVNITNFVSYIRPFDTLESIKQVTNNPSYPVLYPPFVYPNPADYIDHDKFYTNQFYMTAYSVSPDVTLWDTKRLNVSSLITTAATKAAAVNGIVNALADANLTAWFGQTFAGKYPSAAQIAANIVDYIDTDTNCTDSTTSWNDPNPPQYLGLEVTPYLSEIDNSNRFTVANSGTGSNTISWIVYTQVELWNMYTNSWTIPANTDIFLTNIPPVTLVHSNVDTAFVFTNTVSLPPNFTIPVAAGVFNAGTDTYVTYPFPPRQDLFAFTVETNSVTFITYGSNVVTAILRAPSVGRIDYAEIPMAPKTSDPTPVTIDTLGNISPAGGNVRARVSEVNDPRVKPVSTDWRALTTGTGTPGASNTVFDPLVAIPFQADGDISCHIISGGSRDRGTMYPGEMAFIHTGAPWRTFRLQPQITGEPAPPDWAVLDLFSATDSTGVVGRININGSVINASNAVPARVAPLYALLTNSLPGSIVYNNGTAVTNIAAFRLTTANVLPFKQGHYTMVGQICETIGLADDPALNKVTRETPTRGIANLITARSNTFTIWAVAQSIKEVGPPNGVFDPGIDRITGEVKVQAIVERYENPPGTVRFRTRYYRYIYQ